MMDLQRSKILWVDDIRNPPTTVHVDIARTYFEAIELLSKVNYDEIYLDHDIASFDKSGREWTGYDLVQWLVERKMNGQHVPSVYHFLTANPVGKSNMKATIERYLL